MRPRPIGVGTLTYPRAVASRGKAGAGRGKLEIRNVSGLEAAACNCYENAKETYARMLS
jgi:hypothetical protein